MTTASIREAELVLARLCASANTPEERSAVLEMLVRITGRTISAFGQGDAKKINVLLEGSYAYMTEEAAESAKSARKIIDAINGRTN